VIDRWETSGLSQKAFAEKEKIPYTTLLYWRRRLGKTTRGRVRKPAAMTLAPVRIVPDGPRSGRAFELRTSSGLSISVPHGFDEAELRRLLAALSSC
jgi:hypothetical protein